MGLQLRSVCDANTTTVHGRTRLAGLGVSCRGRRAGGLGFLLREARLKFAHCGSFRAGEDVPEWLFVVDPTQPHHGHARITFMVDCHVIETSGGRYVIPDGVPDGGELLSVKARGVSTLDDLRGRADVPVALYMPTAFTAVDPTVP